ncbi:MAG TPA: lysophospholipid acyltransferase family protein [Actinomycetota bacterium]|jgi:1-acyl-sn-glycerol-3-phosphate acyltransferase|nr:lysophospholipid acyltransferase family protein [Actinomycetota bacterium]
MAYWILKNVLLGPFLRLVYRPKATGLENVPEEGPAILASNHLSFIDSLFIPLLLGRRVVFLGKSDYFDSWRTRWFVRSVGVIPVRREGGAASEAAIRAGIKALREGGLVAIYPEGTRSPDGRLYRGKTGVARMALEAQAPVIPVCVKGTDRVMPIGAKLPRLAGRVELTYGAPLTFEQYHDRSKDRFVLRSVTDEIMYEIMMLSDQEYVDEYASKVKKDLATASETATAESEAESAREPAPSESPTSE